MNNPLIPKQKIGNQMDVESIQDCMTMEAAILFYQDVKRRLFDVNQWHTLTGTEAAVFQLTDKSGQPISILTEGCLIRIDIPGPGTKAGDGYDWVEVEAIDKQGDTELEEWTGFRVRPCANPAQPDKGTAHFFSSTATSTFLVRRRGQQVIAEVHGRNEQANEETKGIIDELRNNVVGIAAKLGLSFPQWKLLVAGLTKKVDE